uniref:Alkyl transferase n=1 Tax=Fagus sylvatica TaxID=28930 RepID=A0A2N9IMP6_FAGSY
MEKGSGSRIKWIFVNLVTFLRKFIFLVLSVGPIPDHIAFIMDGNRRYAKKQNLIEKTGHRVGFLALTSMLKKKLKGLIEEESIVNRYGVRVYFLGNLKLLSEPVRLAAERAMVATANNSNAVLSICIAYNSTNEIVHAVEKSCEEKWEKISLLNASGSGYGLIRLECIEKDERGNLIKLIDIEKHMYMSVAPDPGILIRTSGETRLSNFLLWQSAYSYLYSPSVLWPEIGFRHFLWAILNFQRNHFYLEKKRKQL